ncbi:MAG: hypothetical protein AAF242_19365 [Bacteroidota bacterium]
MIPTSFSEWKNCIENDCKIKITRNFVDTRLKVYQNKRNPETIKFVSLYGEQHLNNIIFWLEKSAKEIAQR